ncbi:MAG: PH domain-containing protein [Pirellulaceae bacterium]
MNHCPRCGIELIENARFCHDCGQRLDETKAKRAFRDENMFDSQVEANRQRIQQRRHLDDEERILWDGTFSAKGMVNWWLVAVLLSVALPIGASIAQVDRSIWLLLGGVLALGWLCLFVWLVIQQLGVHYELTDQRLIHREGIIYRVTSRVEVIDVDDVTIEQGIVERLLDVGTIQLHSSDRSDPFLRMEGIDRVHDVALLIDDARRAERIRRGLHIETV